MACWSAENATKAYLRTMRMGEKTKEPNGVEFISALAAGNNAQIMVVACAGAADSTTLALVAAAQQTGGHVICIVSSIQDHHLMSRTTLGVNADHVEFVTGDVKNLLINDYKEADFVAIDCNLEDYEAIISSIQESSRCNNTIVIGYNAFCKETWRNSPLCSELLPIGEGLILIRIAARKNSTNATSGLKKKGNWIVKVDKCTGEEHVYRVRSSAGRVIRA